MTQTGTQLEAQTSRQLLRHALATLAYRGGKTLRDAPTDFDCFQVAQGSRTPGQILAHICDLLDWSLTMCKGEPAWRASEASWWDQDVARFHAALKDLDDFVASDRPTANPIDRLFQGPIADALTHVGQLALLRRLAGAPIKFENYYRAEIQAGRIGADQPAPRKDS